MQGLPEGFVLDDMGSAGSAALPPGFVLDEPESEPDRSFLQRTGDTLAAAGRGIDRGIDSLGLGMAQLVADNTDRFADRRAPLEQRAGELQQERANAGGLEQGAEFITKMMPGFGAGGLLARGAGVGAGLGARIATGAASGAAGGAIGEAVSERSAGESRRNKAKVGAAFGLGVGATLPLAGPAALLAGSAAKTAVKQGPRAIGSAGEALLGGTLRGGSKVLEKGQGAVTRADDVVQRQFLPKELRNKGKAERFVTAQLLDRKVDIDGALQRVDDAAKQGIDLPLYEAVGLDNPAMAKYAKQVSTSSGGGQIARNTLINLGDQLPKSVTRVSNAIARDNLPPAEAAQALKLSATQMLADANKALREKAAPLYREVMQPGNQLRNTSVLNDPVVEDALKKIRNDPVYQRKIGSRPDNEMATLQLVKEQMDDQISMLKRQGAGRKAGLVTEAKDNLVKAMDEEYPLYGDARQIYADDITARNALAESPIGVLAEIAEGDVQKAVKNIFKLSPEQVADVRKQFITAGAGEKFEGAMVKHIQQAMMETTDGRFKTFGNAVFGSGQKRAVLKEALGDTKFGQLEEFFESFDNAVRAKGVTGGSSTATELAAQSDLTGASLLRGSVDMLGTVTDKVFNISKNDILGNPEEAEKLARYLFTPEGTKLLRKLKNTKKTSAAHKKALGGIVAGAGVAGATQ